MPNKEADFTKQEKNAAKSCCLAALIVAIGCFLLVFIAIAGIIIVDTINLRGEKMTMSKRVERYKVAGQFIWFDFKDWVSRQFSEPEIIRCPADPPESEPESEPGSGLESKQDPEPDSGHAPEQESEP